MLAEIELIELFIPVFAAHGLAMFQRSFAITAWRRISGEKVQEREANARTDFSSQVSFG